MAFSSELLVRRQHTLNGMKAFGSAIANAVASLAETELTPAAASHLILTAFRRGIISSVQIPKVCGEWEEPRHDDFRPRTAWSLFNAFTEVLKPRSVTAPQSFVAQTIRLNGLMLPATAEHVVAI